MRHLPNLICVLRILLTWPTVMAIAQQRYGIALALFALAAISDGLDGFLAKRFGWTSELGRILDPVADKLLLVVVFLTCAWHGLVPVWLAAAAIARDVMIGLGAGVYRLWFGPLHGRPTWISKLNTALQILLLIGAIVQAGYQLVPVPVWGTLVVATFVTTLTSGADYLARFLARAWNLPIRTVRS